jgi:hypothetical protein
VSGQDVARWEQPALPTPPQGRDIVDGWAHQVASVAKLATYIAATDFVPKAYRGQDAAVAAAILAGREMGIGPMTSLQHLYVVDGRPAMSAQLMRALVFAHGHSIRFAEVNSARCTLVGRRAGDPAESAVSWSMEDARRAGIAGKQNWAHYPRQMLLARATGELCRALFPDVIGGMAYTVEEAQDIPAEEENGAEPAPTRAVRRNRAPQTPPPPPAGAAPQEAPRPPAPMGGEPPPLPPDAPTPPPSGPNTAQAPTGATPAPDDADEALTGPQRAHVFALLGELDRMEPRAERLRTVGGLVGRDLASLNQLSRTEATALIDVLIRATETPEILEPLVTQGRARLSPDNPTPDPTLWEDTNHDDDNDTDDDRRA